MARFGLLKEMRVLRVRRKWDCVGKEHGLSHSVKRELVLV